MGHTAIHTDRPTFSGLSSPRKTTVPSEKPQSALKALKRLIGKRSIARVPKSELKHGSSERWRFASIYVRDQENQRDSANGRTRRRRNSPLSSSTLPSPANRSDPATQRVPETDRSHSTALRRTAKQSASTGKTAKPFESVRADIETKPLKRQDYEALRQGSEALNRT